VSVYQEVPEGCAILNGLAPIWFGDSPGDFSDGPVVELGVRDRTTVFLARSDCPSAIALGNELSAEFAIEPHGFIHVRPDMDAEPGQVVLSASIDFGAEGTSEVQSIRIDELSLSIQEGFHERCVF